MSICSEFIRPTYLMYRFLSKDNSNEKVKEINNSNEKIRKEAYKINWKIAVPLLLMGGVPGAIYLLGISVANCLSGRKITVEQSCKIKFKRNNKQSDLPKVNLFNNRKSMKSSIINNLISIFG